MRSFRRKFLEEDQDATLAQGEYLKFTLLAGSEVFAKEDNGVGLLQELVIE